jgi:CRISPR-associated protein Cmr4
MESKAYLLHALSPLHAGTGHAADVIDLPIARMKATGIPIVPGSSVKGVLRDARKNKPPEKRNNDNAWDEKVLATFGPDNNKAEEHAGALVVADARLLALPVRSFKGTFAWVTSPLLLRLALRDLGKSEQECPIPSLRPYTAQLAADDCVHQNRLYLQDLDIDAQVSAGPNGAPAKWGALIRRVAFAANDYFSMRFAIVDDETMSFLWDTATQLDQRVRIDEKTRTVATGALWLEESLPAETLLVGLMEADKSRRQKEAVKDWKADQVLEFALPATTPAAETILQFGGKASVGRGRCRLLPTATG